MIDAMILSNGLDTNGQNTRYVRASEKYGNAESIINALAIGRADPAGVVGRLKRAADKIDVGLRIRSAHKQSAYFDFPGDLVWGNRPFATKEDNAQVRTLLKNADLIHLNNSEAGLRYFGLEMLKKPMLLHHHGSLFRDNPQRMLDLAKMRRMVQAVSTVDLLRPAPDVLNWLPTAYDIAALQAMRQTREPDGRIRIVHAPTNRGGKHTELFLEAVRQLQEEGLPIDLVMVEYVTNAECLAIKATADIVYDQLTWGYGCNSVEAWGMGIPVVSGADQWTTHRMKSLWGYLPYEPATEKTLKAVIKRMVLSEDVRAAAGTRGRDHVLRFHDELPALEILAGLYHDAIKAKVRPRIEGKGVQFRSLRTTNRLMHIDGIPIQFSGGVATVTDQGAADQLRRIAKQRPGFGIVEDTEDVA